jgi:hypothetical protein
MTEALSTMHTSALAGKEREASTFKLQPKKKPKMALTNRPRPFFPFPCSLSTSHSSLMHHRPFTTPPRMEYDEYVKSQVLRNPTQDFTAKELPGDEACTTETSKWF